MPKPRTQAEVVAEIRKCAADLEALTPDYMLALQTLVAWAAVVNRRAVLASFLEQPDEQPPPEAA